MERVLKKNKRKQPLQTTLLMRMSCESSGLRLNGFSRVVPLCGDIFMNKETSHFFLMQTRKRPETKPIALRGSKLLIL